MHASSIKNHTASSNRRLFCMGIDTLLVLVLLQVMEFALKAAAVGAVTAAVFVFIQKRLVP